MGSAIYSQGIAPSQGTAVVRNDLRKLAAKQRVRDGLGIDLLIDGHAVGPAGRHSSATELAECYADAGMLFPELFALTPALFKSAAICCCCSPSHHASAYKLSRDGLELRFFQAAKHNWLLKDIAGYSSGVKHALSFYGRLLHSSLSEDEELAFNFALYGRPKSNGYTAKLDFADIYAARSLELRNTKSCGYLMLELERKYSRDCLEAAVGQVQEVVQNSMRGVRGETAFNRADRIIRDLRLGELRS